MPSPENSPSAEGIPGTLEEHCNPSEEWYASRFMPFDVQALIHDRLGENYDLHDHYVNRSLVKVLRTIGFDKVYSRAEGAYLYDRDGNDYLDGLGGYGAVNIGRNHPVVKKALIDLLAMDMPNMVQMDWWLRRGEHRAQSSRAHADKARRDKGMRSCAWG